MKTILNISFTIVLLNGLWVSTFAQKAETIKNAWITKVSKDYIIIENNDEKRELYITSSSKFLEKKKEISIDQLSKDCEANVTYIMDYELEELVVVEVKLMSHKNAGKVEFKGLIEFVDGDIAYVGGHRVKKSAPETPIINKNKGGADYPKFSKIKKGSILKVSGEEGEDGIIYAEKVVVKSNDYTSLDNKLHKDISSRFENKTSLVDQNSYASKGAIKMDGISNELVNDINIQGYVNMVAQKVIPSYAKEEDFKKNQRIDWRVYVIENPVPNASSLANGVIYIHTGLLDILENEAQLATVISREACHVLYKHPTKRYKRNTIIKVPQIIKEGVIGNLLNTFSKSSVSNVFNKGEENEADRVGLMYAHKAGYDIRESIRLWELMEMEVGREDFKSTTKEYLTETVSKNQESMKMQIQKGNPKTPIDKDFVTNFAQGFVTMSLQKWVFASHSQVKKRKRYISRIIDDSYQNEHFDNARKGQEDFSEFTTTLR